MKKDKLRETNDEWILHLEWEGMVPVMDNNIQSGLNKIF